MEEPASATELLFERIEAYGKTTIELTKLKALKTLSNIVTSLVARLSVIVMFSLFVIVLNIGVALLIGEWLGKTYYGFFIVAGFYLVIGVLSHLFLHKWIKAPINNLIISQSLQ